MFFLTLGMIIPCTAGGTKTGKVIGNISGRIKDISGSTLNRV